MSTRGCRTSVNIVGVLLVTLAGCAERKVESTVDGGPGRDRGTSVLDMGNNVYPCRYTPLPQNMAVDLLFVIDNSNSMDEEQRRLAVRFGQLLDALRSHRFGPDKSGKPCSSVDSSGCDIPDLRVGVITTDLGAGNYNLPSCEQAGGDRGRLQSKATLAGCTPPKDRWISYKKGVSNVPGTGTDEIEKVKQAFSCIARVGTGGCGFEQTIDASRRALDPLLNINPGFLRNDPQKNDDAMLAVVYITDEDDCSAANVQLYDPSQQGLSDPLGPLSSYRCFEFGVTCQCSGAKACTRTTSGPRKNCVPGGKYLYRVSSYISFFRQLKKSIGGVPNPDRVFMLALTGPTDRVEVAFDGKTVSLKPSCQAAGSLAVPAVRIEALVHAFARKLTSQEVAAIKAGQSTVPYFVDTSGTYFEENLHSICTSDFRPALRRLGQRIVGSLGDVCLKPPALTKNGGLLCHKGDVICDAKTCGKQVVCATGCLSKADFTVRQVAATGTTAIKKCPAALFEQVNRGTPAAPIWQPKVAANACGAHCPCWRVVSSQSCQQQKGSAPYEVEVMRAGAMSRGTYVEMCALSTLYAWNSKELARLPQCN